jgi:hypothetical protein
MVFFTHQHGWQEDLDSRIFYSTNYWKLDEEICPHIQEHNLKSVKHIYICNKQATNNCVNYFSNVTELTIKNYFKTPDDFISITLNRIIPLKQLNKLVIECYEVPVEQIVNATTKRCIHL